jgi:ribose transport system permease protein
MNQTNNSIEPVHKDRVGIFAAQMGKYGILILMIGLLVVFSILRPDSFATLNNLRSILDNRTMVVMLAFAAMMPLIVGQFDLSIAYIYSLSHIFVVGFIGKSGMNVALAIFLTLLIAVGCGAVNAFVVVKLRVDAFVATLASGTIFFGIALWYTGGKTLYNPVPKAFTDIARGRIWGFPLTAVYMIVTAIILWVVLSNLPVGRRMYATGGNPRAARLTGIRTNRYIVSAFLVSGLIAGIAGIMLGSSLGTASPNTGQSLLLPAFAGAFLGATTIRPGRFNVVGTIVAVYALSIAVSGSQQVGAPQWFEPVFNGTALIVAVALSGWAVRLRAERAKTRQLKLLSGESQ